MKAGALFDPPLLRGDRVRAIRDFDPDVADVSAGQPGVVFEEADAYGDGNGPMVRWVISGSACNVYVGDVELVA